MFKLDERGWGYSFLFFFGALFLLILISVGIAVRYIKKETNKEKDEPVPLKDVKNYDRMYKLLEDKLINAGEYYILDNETYFTNSSDNEKISLNYLVSNGYLENINDPIYGDPCEGFVIINQNKSVRPFIKCSSYTTSGYNNWS